MLPALLLAHSAVPRAARRSRPAQRPWRKPTLMFNVVHLEDDIRVQPQDLSKPPLDAVTDCLEQLYIDRVIPELGLVVTIYDVQVHATAAGCQAAASLLFNHLVDRPVQLVLCCSL